MKKSSFLLLIILFTAPGLLAAQDAKDREAVRMAVLDYVEGIYNVEPERIERSVHTGLAKLGYWRPRDASTYHEPGKMSYEELVNVAKTWNAKKRDMSEAPKQIEIYDVMDQTATVKLSAAWGIDYMHLAKMDGTWKIINVLWQSYPPDTASN